MAITRGSYVIIMDADGDSLADETVIVQAMATRGEVNNVQDGHNNTLYEFATTGGGTFFSHPVPIRGIQRGDGAGDLYIFHT